MLSDLSAFWLLNINNRFVALEPKVGNLIAHGKAGGKRMYIDSRGTAQNEWTNNSEQTFECGGK